MLDTKNTCLFFGPNNLLGPKSKFFETFKIFLDPKLFWNKNLTDQNFSFGPILPQIFHEYNNFFDKSLNQHLLDKIILYQHFFWKERCQSEFPAIFMRDTIVSDWPNSPRKDGWNYCVDCLANQRQLFPS